MMLIGQLHTIRVICGFSAQERASLTRVWPGTLVYVTQGRFINKRKLWMNTESPIRSFILHTLSAIKHISAKEEREQT